MEANNTGIIMDTSTIVHFTNTLILVSVYRFSVVPNDLTGTIKKVGTIQPAL